MDTGCIRCAFPKCCWNVLHHLLEILIFFKFFNVICVIVVYCLCHYSLELQPLATITISITSFRLGLTLQNQDLLVSPPTITHLDEMISTHFSIEYFCFFVFDECVMRKEKRYDLESTFNAWNYPLAGFSVAGFVNSLKNKMFSASGTILTYCSDSRRLMDFNFVVCLPTIDGILFNLSNEWNNVHNVHNRTTN